MNCFNEEQLQQYLDNEYGQEEMEAIGHHLETCLACTKSLAQLHQRRMLLKQSLDLLVTKQPAIPQLILSKKADKQRRFAVRYLLPLAAAAGLLLLVLLQPWADSDKTPDNGQTLQFAISEEVDANKPVTDYPLIITVVDPDGNVTQTAIY